MRLTATDPGCGTGLMGVKGMEEVGAGLVDNMLNGGNYDSLWSILDGLYIAHL
jgi:hypothetical protein